jgi:hypothetical protein
MTVLEAQTGGQGRPLTVSTKEAARMLNVSHRTLEDWRRKGCGPPSRRWGRMVRYVLSELEAFVSRAPVTNTGQPSSI